MSRRGRYKREEDKPLSSINYGQNIELEKNRKACEANSSMLADDAFADDVVDQDTGHYYQRETYFTDSWSTLGEYQKVRGDL